MGKRRHLSACFFAFLMGFFVISPTFAAMTSTNYQILWDTAGLGGDSSSSSGSYNLRDTLGGLATGNATSASYALATGYRAGIYDRTVDFSVVGADRGSQVAAVSVAGTTLTVTSTADYAVSDYVVLVQNEGAAQVSAVGRVSSLTATTLIVDAWATNGTMPTIDGSDDVAYVMSSSPSINLGTLSASDVATATLAWNASADVAQGYSVYVMADHDMRDAVDPLTVLSAVSDGAVTAGVTEYGARSSDTSLALSLFDTQDSAITTSLQQIASRSDNSFSTRDFLTLKAAVASGATAASYTQELTILFVGDY